MAKVRVRKESGKLFMDFRYMNKRCREQTSLTDTPANRRKLQTLLERIQAEITLGSFSYEAYFPNSPLAAGFNDVAMRKGSVTSTPIFKEFSKLWLSEMKIQWRPSHYDTIKNILEIHLDPAFGNIDINQIRKVDILNFRSTLASVAGRKSGTGLTASRINHIMTPLRMILNEASDRYDFASPYQGIKSLKVPRTDVEPFTLEEVRKIIDHVRPDFRNYYTIRFLAGLRTGEIDGLKWKYVDFERRQILVREALVRGESSYTKNDGSQREIDMSQPVYDALKSQHDTTKNNDFVFCTRNGSPISHNNVTKRVWYPLLRHLDLRKRRPYQTRHTAATLWLASGESPEWIARQMGHTTTEMLFRVYSRYVPNLTRRDGSAFDRLLDMHFDTKTQGA